MGIIRSLQLVTTLIVAGPAALVGFLHVLDGRYPEAALFIGLAVVFTVLSEYVYRRLADRTVGRLKGLASLGGRRKPGE